MNIIGLSDVNDLHHDNSAALIQDGNLVFAASEERFTRRKHDPSFPLNALKACLDHADLGLDDIDYFAVGWPKTSFYPYLFTRKAGDVPKAVFSLLKADPLAFVRHSIWSLGDKILNRQLQNELDRLGVDPSRVEYVSHHQAHAASAYRLSGYQDCLTVVVDTFGPDRDGQLVSGGIYICHDGAIDRLVEIPAYTSVGSFYTGVTVALGFTFGDGEGKTMGLAAYGDPDACYAEMCEIAPRFEDGEWKASPGWLDLALALNRDLFLATPTGRVLQRMVECYSDRDVAASAQRVLEELLVSYVQHYWERTSQSRLALAGGVFLNIKANGRILSSLSMDDVFIHPHAGDGGTAVGAALELHYEKTKQWTPTRMESAALGREYLGEEIEQALAEFAEEIVYERVENVSRVTAEKVAEGKVIGWFQGRPEWGPRALGSRSVVADPRNEATKERINDQMKRRDWFMPFAPSTLVEQAADYFVGCLSSPFMLLGFDVADGKAEHIPAVIHVDKTARPQTVSGEVNPLYYDMIHHFYELTGIPLVLNTSFNRHGLPIVETPQDAIEHLTWGCVDELAIGPFVARRRDEGPSG